MIFVLPLILLFHLVLLLKTQFTLWPEMVVYPYLINKGFLLYKDIINPYPPTLSYFLAIFAKLFGYSPLPYKVLTWFCLLLLDVLIFSISNGFSKSRKIAAVSTVFFVLLSLPFGGNGIWFDLIQTPFILLGFYFTLQYLKSQKSKKTLILSGFFLATAFFIKQQTIWLIVFLTAVLIFKEKLNFLKKIPFILLPFIAIFSLEIIFLFRQGILNNFIYWAWYFPFFLASKMPGYVLLPTKRQLLVLLVLYAFFCPLIIKRKAQTNLILITSLVLLLFAYPRFDFFHLVPFLSVLSLLVGQNLLSVKKVNALGKFAFFLSAVFLLVFTARYLLKNTGKEVRFFEADTLNAAKVLQNITSENDSVFIQNGPDQLLVISGRLPTKPWAIQFPWYLEKTNLQKEMIEGLESKQPRYIVYKPYDSLGKYQIGSYRPAQLADLLDSNYKNYRQISPTLWLKIKTEK